MLNWQYLQWITMFWEIFPSLDPVCSHLFLCLHRKNKPSLLENVENMSFVNFKMEIYSLSNCLKRWRWFIFYFKNFALNSFVWCHCGLNLELHSCKAGALPLESCLQSFCSCYFGDGNHELFAKVGLKLRSCGSQPVK
jgi:hypothetical protein